jgi:NADH dehydrogenase [ubiquinone] 1 alpha subcomplex assembly factor 1
MLETRLRFTVLSSILMMLVQLASSSMLYAEEGEQMLLSFDKPEAAKQWRTINDNVMGGVSEGKSRITKKKTLEFYGSLSLENNGGFASVRSGAIKLDLDKYGGVVLRVRGDGRPYYCNLHVPTIMPAFSYRAKVDTQKAQWQEIRIPWKDFRATAFGRELESKSSLEPSKVNAIGFLIADKKAEPFKLEVEWIKGIPKTAKKK